MCDRFVNLMYMTTNRRSKKYVSENDEEKYFSNLENVKEIAKTLKCTLKKLKETITFLSKKSKIITLNIFHRISIISTAIH